ncbi:MAG: T9SS type A sorting domain-containing protein [Candidatus Amulumruptor caecigallinarius]|nr:T9SS type A sorting domain-containing protein [Candidatus Amulumruptor caecigallinarius]
MRKIKATHILASLICLTICAVMPVHVSAKGWETVKIERQDARQVVKESEIEIKSAPGVIIVTSNHPVQIKIFTILGRTVNTATLPAGKSQLQLPTHGVYIVKVGDLTCKVAV